MGLAFQHPSIGCFIKFPKQIHQNNNINNIESWYWIERMEKVKEWNGTKEEKNSQPASKQHQKQQQRSRVGGSISTWMENKVSTVHYIFKLRLTCVAPVSSRPTISSIHASSSAHQPIMSNYKQNKWTKTIIRTHNERAQQEHKKSTKYHQHYFVEPCDFFTNHSYTHSVCCSVRFAMSSFLFVWQCFPYLYP